MGNEEFKQRCECGKICYSKKEAQTAVNAVRNRPNHFYRGRRCVHTKPRRNKIPIRVYPCDLCGFWHTTSHVERKQLRNKYDYRY